MTRIVDMSIDPRFIEGELRGETPPQPDLSDLRETILAALDSVHDMDVTFEDYADAIVRALPGAIKPLVWVKHPGSDIWRCDTQSGTYKVFGFGAKPSWDFDGFTEQISATEDTLEAAKAAAEAHYRAGIMAAFGEGG